MTIVERALELVANDTRIGLGSGRAARTFVKALGERIRSGRLRVYGVPTSEETATLCMQEDIPFLDVRDAGTLDLTVDGADEVDPSLDLIKGYGRAFVREKIVAASSRRLLILVGDEKLVRGGSFRPAPPGCSVAYCWPRPVTPEIPAECTPVWQSVGLAWKARAPVLITAVLIVWPTVTWMPLSSKSRSDLLIVSRSRSFRQTG